MEETDKTSQGVHLSDEEDADMDQGFLLPQGECRLLEFWKYLLERTELLICIEGEGNAGGKGKGGYKYHSNSIFSVRKEKEKMSVPVLLSRSKALWFVIRTIELAPNLPNSSLAVSLHLICQQQGWTRLICDFVGTINASVQRRESLATSLGYLITPAMYLTINTVVWLFSVLCLEPLTFCEGLWGK